MDLSTGPESSRDSTQVAAKSTTRATGSRPRRTAGDRPSIDDFLHIATDAVQPGLFRHLLGLELDYRRELGESPGPTEYRRRFPGYEVLIDSIFVGFNQKSRLIHGEDLDTASGTAPNCPTSGSAQSPRGASC